MNAKGSNGTSMQLEAIHETKPVGEREPRIVRVCRDSNDAIPVAQYIVTEMKKNPFTPEGKKITSANLFDPAAEVEQWNAQPWHAKLGGMPDYYSIATGHKLAAYQIWTMQVAPGQPWDHKPIIKAMLIQRGIFRKGWQRYAQYDYFYDIWSNIHYGYVGTAVGFSSNELLGGAGLAQALSDAKYDLHKKRQWPTMQHHPENGAWPNSADDVQDHISIQLGIDLYTSIKPNALSADLLLSEITFVELPWGSGGDNHAKRLHQCHS
ncbi:hypothetical protein HBH1_02682 [Herbaspirillum sp. BH-1]|uniref:Bacterial toxin 44 domain-containing protein n=1 Tax=Herbaspirillum frisingense TaxID=92645 RepID=A0ABU1PJD1_9BURK|nr:MULTISPECIES: polymorphic toxin type 44 domain-containing protein [Herbaspirillum]MDR6585433.1 hypothetical protein [Herbaspirillum frisingense]PLY59191.1 hypothetical protein HBH1_02682 [Herbaspirillum sp. BH-1]